MTTVLLLTLDHAPAQQSMNTNPGSLYPKKMSTLEDLEPDTDNDVIDVTDFFKRPPNDKRSPRPKQIDRIDWED